MCARLESTFRPFLYCCPNSQAGRKYEYYNVYPPQGKGEMRTFWLTGRRKEDPFTEDAEWPGAPHRPQQPRQPLFEVRTQTSSSSSPSTMDNTNNDQQSVSSSSTSEAAAASKLRKKKKQQLKKLQEIDLIQDIPISDICSSTASTPARGDVPMVRV